MIPEWIHVSHGKPTASLNDHPKDKYQVTIDNFSFMPATLNVPAETTVTWVNHDDVPHDVISTEKVCLGGVGHR